jgi:pyruvate carboxylase
VPSTARAGRPPPAGTRQKLLEIGPEKFAQWILQQKPLLFTDTTFRDAHQSLMATRMRTCDMLTVADAVARRAPQLFSLEMWGGATFDTAMRFLREDPWERLRQLRERIPNICFQMLFRGSNAVGYSNYPDNVVRGFVKHAAASGMDIFRIFDSLNYTPNLKAAMEAVRGTHGLCEAAICYTGDILDPKRTKYSLRYYVKLAKELEGMGAHILAIKDMAGLCKPQAAKLLVAELRKHIGIPIHFHTHDTAGIQASSILNAAEEGLEIADGALASMSGGTSQVNLNTLVEAIRYSPRESKLKTDALTQLSEYWKSVRQFYAPFEGESLVAAGDLYQHEMPGGQYTNLYQQAKALGLSDRWEQVCKMYASANELLGDIVKVTPTSKAVGDLALFMVANDLSAQDIANGTRELSFPGSVLDLVGGMMGQPPGGFPEQVKRAILRNNPEVKNRPGETLPSHDFDATAKALAEKLGRDPNMQETVTSALYPKVFDEFISHGKEYGDVSLLPTPIFFFGPSLGEEFSVDIESGKRLIIKFLAVGEPRPDGVRTVFFELNGQPREVEVVDKSIETKAARRTKADPADPTHVAAAMPGMVIGVAIAAGNKVAKGQKLLSLEAMKMETVINAERDGEIAQLLVSSGSQVEAGDLLLILK